MSCKIRRRIVVSIVDRVGTDFIVVGVVGKTETKLPMVQKEVK